MNADEASADVSAAEAEPAPLAEEQRPLVGPLLRTLLAQHHLTSEDLHTVLAGTLGKLARALRAQGVFLLLFDAELEEIRFLAAHLQAAQRDRDLAARQSEVEGAPVPAGELGFVADPAWRQQPMVLAHVAADLPPPLVLARLLSEPLRTVALVPIALDARLSALLVGANDADPGGFSRADLARLVEVGRVMGDAIRLALGLRGPLTEEEWARCAATLTGCRFDRLEAPCPCGCGRCSDGSKVDDTLLTELGRPVLERFEVFPLARLGDKELRAAVADPLDWSRLGDFEAVTGYRIAEKVVVPRGNLRLQLQRAFPQPDAWGGELQPGDVGLLADDLSQLYSGEPGHARAGEQVNEHSPPIVRLANRLIEEASAQGASDVHLEVCEEGLVVRYRIDGLLRDRIRLPRATANPLIARLKIMSELDIAEHRLPQDGRIPFAKFNPAVDIDLRVSVVPMLRGEGVVLRLLDSHRAAMPLDHLGFSPENLRTYRRVIHTPYGMILHCGPTGSGKSMSLYAALNEINDRKWKVLTAEDPVEYTLPGINQLQVRPGIGLTFAAALRSFLRHDPDIILLGEIRDPETAHIAVEASLTGHLLLSTLHTNDAASAIPRLVRLGIEPFMVASTVVCVCAQRLVRRLCLLCRRERVATASEVAYLMQGRSEGDPEKLYGPGGCDACHHAGYRGRTGLHELMVLGSRLRQLIGEGGNSEEIKATARKHGMRTLFQDAMHKVRAGITSMDEALRVTTPDEL